MRSIHRCLSHGPRRLSAAAVAAVTALAALAAASATAYAPPKDTPDLAKMVPQPSDFAPGAKPTSDGYYQAPQEPGERALYLDVIRGVTMRGGVKPEAINTGLELFETTAAAQAEFTRLQRVNASHTGRMLLFEFWVPSPGKGSNTPFGDAHFATHASIGVGQQSSLVSISVATADLTFFADVVLVRVGAVVAQLNMAAAKPNLTASVATALARTVAAHITSVLSTARG